jgi:hypothetical protein
VTSIPRTLRAHAWRACLAFAVLAGEPATAGACIPAAVIDGDHPLAGDVTRALSDLGVGGLDAEACRAVTATVRRCAGGLALELRLGERIERRVVADAPTAAAWIESWVRDEAEPLWSAPPPLPITAPSMVGETPRPAPSRARARGPELALAFGRDLERAGASWDGLAIAACYRIGAWCGGLAARGVVNTTLQSGDPDGGSGGTTAARRTSLVIAATAERRLRVGRAALVPRVTAGLARTTSERYEPEPPCFSGDCPQEITYVGDGFTGRNIAARLGAGVGVVVPLADWLVLDGSIGFELAPGAHPAPYRHDPARYPIGQSVGIDPGDPLLDLPGDPSWLVSTSVGLRAEAP